jgi:hypothetical protein
MNLYSIYDTKTEMFSRNVVVQENNSVAIRSFGETMESENQISKYPEDFSLYCLGSFDPQTGLIESDIKQIANATEFIKTIEE